MLRKVFHISHNFFNALLFWPFLLDTSAIIKWRVPKGRGVKTFIIVGTCVIRVVREWIYINIHSNSHFLGNVSGVSLCWHCLQTLVPVRGCYNNWLWAVIATIKVLTSLNTNTTKPQHCRSWENRKKFPIFLIILTGKSIFRSAVEVPRKFKIQILNLNFPIINANDNISILLDGIKERLTWNDKPRYSD